MNRRPVEPLLTEYLHSRAAAMGMPLSGTFELTPCCNLACRMCYVRLSEEEQRTAGPLRSAREWLALGEQAVEAGMLYLLLTGGEPFLRPDIREILEGLHRLGLVISINTNATLIGPDTIAWLRESPPARVNVSLYGAGPETYRTLCGDPAAYEQTVKGIALLKEAGIPVKLSCVLTPYNVRDLEDVTAFARREELPLQLTGYVFPPLRRDGSMTGQNHRLTPEQAAQTALTAFGAGELPPERCAGEAGACRAGRCSFWVTWDGRMLPCGMLPGPGTENVFARGFAGSWEKTRELARCMTLPPVCQTCPDRALCGVCPAAAVTETGNFHTAPPYRCRMARAMRRALNTGEGEK